MKKKVLYIHPLHQRNGFPGERYDVMWMMMKARSIALRIGDYHALHG